MDPSSHPGLVTSPEMTTSGNLDILAHTAASQSADVAGLSDTSTLSGFPVLKIAENTTVSLPLLSQHIRIEGQPGGPMLSQAQIQKLLGSADPEKRMSPVPLSIIPTTGFSDPGQQSPASLSQNSQILHYRPSGSSGDAMLSAINYSENEILQDGGFDVTGNLGNLDDGLLGGMGNAGRLSENPGSNTFDLFDGESDTLNMDALSPGLIMTDSGSLSTVNTVTDSNDSADTSVRDDRKKQSKSKGKAIKGHVSPNKSGSLDCNICHKVFNNTSALAKHKLTHSDERKYLCTICEKKFKRQDHLNGHLMTHRDKKPYQCMVTGCDKSYCDARSLKRHLENYHQHTTDQIATEMVAAASNAAEVLAEASSAAPTPTVTVATTSVPTVHVKIGVPAVNNTGKDSAVGNSGALRETFQSANTDNKVITQHLMISPSANPSVTTRVAVPVTLPVVSNPNAASDSQQAAIIQYEAFLKQQQLQEQQQQLQEQLQEQQQQQQQQQLQEQQQQLLEQQTQKEKEREQLQIFKLQLQEMELQAIATAAQLQQEQQQQQQQQQNLATVSWQDQSSVKSESSIIQSPKSGERSPAYAEMSPGIPDVQQGISTSPIRSPAQLWYSPTSTGQQLVGTPPNNVTVGDAKNVEELAKPVVCTICQRRFKNVPALNGHMRLHGGYFKKDSALKEEKKKKGEMAPPALVPARPAIPVHLTPQSTAAVVVKKSKGAPLMQSPPSEEMHALHWQQKQQEQQLQQQLHQHLQQQQQQQLQQQQQQLQQQQQQHDLQQQEQLHQQQLQLQQQHEVQLQQEQEEQQQLGHLELLHLQQLPQLQQAGLDAQQIEQLKLQLQQTQIHQHQQQQQQQQQQVNHQDRQLLFDHQPQLHQQEQSNSYVCLDPSPQVPQSPHLPTSPHYPQSPHIVQSPRVPQSPQVPPSPGVQSQGSVDHMQSPAMEFGHQGLQQELPEGVDRNLIRTIQQMQLHSQGVNLENIQPLTVQSANITNVQNLNPTIIQSGVSDANTIQRLSVNPSVNIHHDNSAFQSQISGSFVTSGPMISSAASSANNHTSEIVTQIISSLENLGEVPRGSMEQVHKTETDPLSGIYTARNRDFHSHLTSNENNGVMKNSFTEFAQNNVMHNEVSPLGHNTQFASHFQSQAADSRASVKQELLKHLASKPTSPRAAQNAHFSFQSNTNLPNVKQKLVSEIVKQEPGSNPMSSTQQRNSEIKRRLSAGPEDFRSTHHTSASSDSLRDHGIGEYPRTSLGSQSDNFRPRMRSKSGDDYRLHKWHSEDPSFMRPKSRVEDFAHRPRSKTDEHLSKWNNRELLSRSDGAGVFRNPSSFAPNSFKIKRKNRPAPLIIPPHGNMFGFQSRLRSPRIWAETSDSHNTAPVPYTPPPMLSPIRRGSGLFWSLSYGTPQVPPPTSAPPTPRASLIRSGSLMSADDISKDLTSHDQGQPLESDIQPHVNVGSQYQSALPHFSANKSLALHEPSREEMVWDPACMADNTEDDLQAYQNLACCAAVKGNGSNVEHALHVLYLANGNIQKAMLMLMTGCTMVPTKHTLASYTYQESDIWGSADVDNYTQAILKYDKDFFTVAKEVKTKTVRQCVQFYYLWKKVLIEDHKRLRVLRRKREQDYNLRSTRQQAEQPEQAVSIKDETESNATEEGGREVEEEEEDMLDLVSTSSDMQEEEEEEEEDEDKDSDIVVPMLLTVSPVPTPPSLSPATAVFACDYPECNSSFSSKPALNAHLKIHVKVTKSASTFPSPSYESGHIKPKSSTPPYRSPARNDGQEESFPCKLCGRVFSKVKSRSAHMKVHRPDQDKEREKKAKAAKQQASALEKSALEKSVLDSIIYPSHHLANGPSSQLKHFSVDGASSLDQS